MTGIGYIIRTGWLKLRKLLNFFPQTADCSVAKYFKNSEFRPFIVVVSGFV